MSESGGRSPAQMVLDGATFPLRALILFDEDRWGLSSLRTERFDYVSREGLGHTLDIGCGPHNRFITEFLGGNGIGVDVYRYDGLDDANILADPTSLPFGNATFDSVTFIANLNHVPRDLRDLELAEASRVLRPGGKIVVTMGNPLAEIVVHRVVEFYDRVFGTRFDVDGERGIAQGEEYYLLDGEIRDRLRRAGFHALKKRYFLTQWGLNHLIVGLKRD